MEEKNELSEEILTAYTFQMDEYLDLDSQYRKLMFLHEAAIQEVTTKLNILKSEFQFSNDRNPISYISSRIKSKESLLNKMKKRGIPMNVHAMLENINDIAGVRVSCPFIEDVYYVARMLVKQKGIEVIEVKDYIRDPKPNGYRSLHVILMVEVRFSQVIRKVKMELQIRTIAMDFWASTEHQIRYKKNRIFTEEDQKRLKASADLMAKADEIMQEFAGDFGQEQW